MYFLIGLAAIITLIMFPYVALAIVGLWFVCWAVDKIVCGIIAPVVDAVAFVVRAVNDERANTKRKKERRLLGGNDNEMKEHRHV